MHKHIGQLTATFDQIGKRVLTGKPQQRIDIGQAKIAIKQYHSPSKFPQRQRKIHRDSRLADAALSTGHSDNLHRMHTIHVY